MHVRPGWQRQFDLQCDLVAQCTAIKRLNCVVVALPISADRDPSVEGAFDSNIAGSCKNQLYTCAHLYRSGATMQEHVLRTSIATGTVSIGAEAVSKPSLMRRLAAGAPQVGNIVCNGLTRTAEFIHSGALIWSRSFGIRIYLIEKGRKSPGYRGKRRKMGFDAHVAWSVVCPPCLPQMLGTRMINPNLELDFFCAASAGSRVNIPIERMLDLQESVCACCISIWSQIAIVPIISTGFARPSLDFRELRACVPVEITSVAGLVITTHYLTSLLTSGRIYESDGCPHGLAFARTCSVTRGLRPDIFPISGRAITRHHHRLVCDVK